MSIYQALIKQCMEEGYTLAIKTLEDCMADESIPLSVRGACQLAAQVLAQVSREYKDVEER